MGGDWTYGKLGSWDSYPEHSCFPFAMCTHPINTACASLDLGLGLIFYIPGKSWSLPPAFLARCTGGASEHIQATWSGGWSAVWRRALKGSVICPFVSPCRNCPWWLQTLDTGPTGMGLCAPASLGGGFTHRSVLGARGRWVLGHVLSLFHGRLYWKPH